MYFRICHSGQQQFRISGDLQFKRVHIRTLIRNDYDARLRWHWLGWERKAQGRTKMYCWLAAVVHSHASVFFLLVSHDQRVPSFFAFGFIFFSHWYPPHAFRQLHITSGMQSQRSLQDYFGTANNGCLPVVRETGGGYSQSPKSNGGGDSIAERSLLSSPKESHTYTFTTRPSQWLKKDSGNRTGAAAFPQLQDSTKDQHGGRSIRTVQMDFMKPIGLSTDAELRVMRTTSGEQADAKGIRPGMRVVAIGGYVVSTEFQLRLAVAEYRRRTSSECAVVFLQERPWPKLRLREASAKTKEQHEKNLRFKLQAFQRITSPYLRNERRAQDMKLHFISAVSL